MRKIYLGLKGINKRRKERRFRLSWGEGRDGNGKNQEDVEGNEEIHWIEKRRSER